MPAKRLFHIILLILLYGCQTAIPSIEPVDTAVTETETPFPTFAPFTPTTELLAREQELWSKGPHSSTYDLENASNTYCAMCHSPLNWDPAAMVDAAPTVLRSEWQNVGCEICHGGEGEDFSGSLAWWDQDSRQYESIASSSDLCIKCHRDEEDHNTQITMGSSAHVDFDCVTCHEPHSLRTSCSNSGCHDGVRPESSMPPATPTGGQHPNNAAFCGGANCHPAATQAAASNDSIHGAVHASVSCIACHDASGMPVAPSLELGYWITFTTGAPDGMGKSGPAMSHEIQASVDCVRCHFEENTWELPQVAGNEFAR